MCRLPAACLFRACTERERSRLGACSQPTPYTCGKGVPGMRGIFCPRCSPRGAVPACLATGGRGRMQHVQAAEGLLPGGLPGPAVPAVEKMPGLDGGPAGTRKKEIF